MIESKISDNKFVRFEDDGKFTIQIRNELGKITDEIHLSEEEANELYEFLLTFI